MTCCLGSSMDSSLKCKITTWPWPTFKSTSCARCTLKLSSTGRHHRTFSIVFHSSWPSRRRLCTSRSRCQTNSLKFHPRSIWCPPWRTRHLTQSPLSTKGLPSKAGMVKCRHLQQSSRQYTKSSKRTHPCLSKCRWLVLSVNLWCSKALSVASAKWQIMVHREPCRKKTLSSSRKSNDTAASRSLSRSLSSKHWTKESMAWALKRSPSINRSKTSLRCSTSSNLR